MEILSEQDAHVLRSRFDAELERPLRLTLFVEPPQPTASLRPCITCEDTQRLMEEVASLTDLLELEVIDASDDPLVAAQWGITATPTLAIDAGEDLGVRFLGLPSGYEFLSFLETLVAFSEGDSFGLSLQTRKRLDELGSDLDIQVYSTPT